MNTLQTLNRTLLVSLGLSIQTADLVMTRIEELETESRRPSFEKLHAEYLQWVEATFANETVDEQITHLKEEWTELRKTDFQSGEEFADVLMFLFCVAEKRGVNVFQAFRDKFETNKARKWEKGEKGFRHV